MDITAPNNSSFEPEELHDQRWVDVRVGCDLADRRARESVSSEPDARGFEDQLAGLVRARASAFSANVSCLRVVGL